MEFIFKQVVNDKQKRANDSNEHEGTTCDDMAMSSQGLSIQYSVPK
jgi:hypothetical protein